MHKLGAKTIEIPIQFGLRDRGDSKMEKDNFSDSVKVVLKIRLNENNAFFRFLAVGLVGLFTDTAIFNLFRATLFPSHIAAILSGGIAMLVTYALNNFWSFNDRKITTVPKLVTIFTIYAISSAVPIFVRSQLVLLFVNAFGDKVVPSNTGFAIGILIGLVWNFTVYSKIIWKKQTI
jgi:putative flippase GtrA